MKDVGNLLKETRESQGYGIEQVAEELKVRPEYLKILESGDGSSTSRRIRTDRINWWCHCDSCL